MELVSIIVPVFNSERYLEKCIESVKNQTYAKWELVLVDDGSTDSSYDICIKHAETDVRIQCIHTENMGRVHARKTGMKNASGNIIAFMDSDDWIEAPMLYDMMADMRESGADCVIAGYIETTAVKETAVYNTMEAGVYAGELLHEKFFTKMLCCQDFFEFGIWPFLWNKIYRREVIEDVLMDTDDRIVVGEDAVCLFSALLKAKTVSVMQKAYYHYCIHTGSTMHVYREDDNELANIRMQHIQMRRDFMRSDFCTVMLPQMNRYLLHHLLVRALFCFDREEGKVSSFPFAEIKEGSRVIIYGAGAFGHSIYQHWMNNGQFEVCAWCDSAYEKYQNMGYTVEAPQEAIKREFDYIAIAVMKRASAESIAKALKAEQVEESKLLWLDIKSLDECSLDMMGHSFCIYGAGIVAASIYTAIRAAYNSTPAAFLVSDMKGNPCGIDKIPVKSLSEWDETDKETLYLIAVPVAHHGAVKDAFRRKGIDSRRLVMIDNSKENKIMGAFYRDMPEFATAQQALERKKPGRNPGIEVFQAKCHVDKALLEAYRLPDYVLPIQAGAAIADKIILERRDDDGDNISTKNRNYCELTASYYAWKNSSSDYKGLCHYRRVFDLNDAQMAELLSDAGIDAVLPYPSIHYPDISTQHLRYVNDDDWNAMLRALEEAAPEYYASFPCIFKGQFFYNFNMLIAKREVFDDYCNFMFSVLERTEELTSPKGWERADRFAGYLGENLTTLYFMANKDRLKIVHTGKVWLT